MPPTFGPRYAIDYTGTPTHMSTADFAIWQSFRRSIPRNAIGLYFDVRLGQGRPTHETATQEEQAVWYTLTTKRADVVIEMPQGWLLVELRDHAQLNAIGRLLGYAKLWKADPPDARPLNLLLVTNNNDQDVRELAADHSIGYLVL